MKFPETQSFAKSDARLRRYKNIFVKCVVCVTWDDELRTIKIVIPSVAFNREQLDAFQRLFEAYSLLSKPMKSKSLLKIYDRKNIELISGSFKVSCNKLLFINQTKSNSLRYRILMFN